MRILFVTRSFNSLAQRLHVAMRDDGHDVSVEFDINDAVTLEAARLFRPDLVVAPFLKRRLPEALTRMVRCLVVHPGPEGDRGPAALDHAILEGMPEWGVTVLEATADYDAGPVWASIAFPMRDARKSSLYLHEVGEAAVTAMRCAIRKIDAGEEPRPLSPSVLADGWRGPVPAGARAIDWHSDRVVDVLRKIASADGQPGCQAELAGRTLRLFNARKARAITTGEPGRILGRCGGAVVVAARDGAVLIGHLVDPASPHAFKLPAASVLAGDLAGLPEFGAEADSRPVIAYHEQGKVGVLSFDFYNGAMGANACRALLFAYRQALGRPTDVLVLMGKGDHFSNGLDLNLIEAAESPADESMANIEAMDDLVEAIIRTTDRLTIAALSGNAGAGGVFLARGADEVWLSSRVILNPHYKDMGNLYGSEFWTYLLPLHVGPETMARLSALRLPVGAAEALRLGLADRVLASSRNAFTDDVIDAAAALAADPGLALRIVAKQERRARDEAVRPLADYRRAELDRMARNFYGFDTSYHVARNNFVRKVAKGRTPLALARHRQTGWVVPEDAETRKQGGRMP